MMIAHSMVKKTRFWRKFAPVNDWLPEKLLVHLFGGIAPN